MVIPDRIVEVIHGPSVMYVGTRDAHLRPAQTYVIGAVIHPDREALSFFIPESRSARILSDLQNNGRVALSVGLISHEAYQLKGGYVSSRPTEVKDHAVQEIHRSKLISSLIQGGYPEQLVQLYVGGFIYKPGIAVAFRVEEIFLQTPGPSAGKKIS